MTPPHLEQKMSTNGCPRCGAPTAPLAIRCQYCDEPLGTASAATQSDSQFNVLSQLDEIEDAILQLESRPTSTSASPAYKFIYWYFVISTLGFFALFLPAPKDRKGWSEKDTALASHTQRQIRNVRDVAGREALVQKRLRRAETALEAIIDRHR